MKKLLTSALKSLVKAKRFRVSMVTSIHGGKDVSELTKINGDYLLVTANRGNAITFPSTKSAWNAAAAYTADRPWLTVYAVFLHEV